VSEFSESYHLESRDQQDGVRLLQAAKLDGFAFPEANGWVTIIPESEFGEELGALIRANRGTLLRYLFDDDSGWMFDVYQDKRMVCGYQFRDLDWSDPEDRIVITDDRLEMDLLEELARRHGADGEVRAELERILHPRIVRRPPSEDVGAFDDLADWPAGETDDRVAYAFARLMRLSYYAWRAWHYHSRLGRGGDWVSELGALRP
jgi:hypothetical protein